MKKYFLILFLLPVVLFAQLRDSVYYTNPYFTIKGHMAPAASFNCNRDMLYSTFTYVNSSLQQQSLNRGVWKQLEVRERELAMEGDVKVFIRIEYPTSPIRVTTGAAIPLGYYKELKVGNRRECYYFKNITPSVSNLETYKCNCRNVIK